MPKSSPKPGQALGSPTQGACSAGDDVVDSECGGNQATADNADYRPPETQQRRPAQGQRDDDAQGSQRGQRAATGSAAAAWSNRPKITEARVMESIIITVPPTVGVTILRRMNSHLEMTS